MASLKDALAAVSDERLEAALEKTAATVQQLTLTLLVVSAFAVSVAGTPDIALLLPDSAISVPTLGGMPLRIALIVGPIVLVTVRVYLQLYVNHWRRLNRVAKARGLERSVTMSPMRDGLLRVGTIGIRYALVPGAMAIIAWKALGDPIPLGYALAMATVFVTLAHVIQDLPAKRFVWVPALVLIGLVVLAISEPGQRHLPEPLSTGLPSTVEFHRPLDLRYADLSRRVLNKADLRRANLELATLANSKLQEADLWAANLERANLADADLRNADLEGAVLLDANLTGARLWKANLTTAYLVRANLTDANLERANLTDADLRLANLTDTYVRFANLTYTDVRFANLTAGSFEGSLHFGTYFHQSVLTALRWPAGHRDKRALAFVDRACFAPLILGSFDGRPAAKCGHRPVAIEDLDGLDLSIEDAVLGDVLVPATDLPTSFADYACVSSDDKQPLGLDAQLMDLKLCSHPDFRERMRWYFCGMMHELGRAALDPTNLPRLPPFDIPEWGPNYADFEINTETCADVGLGTEWEREWLEETFPDFAWDDVPR